MNQLPESILQIGTGKFLRGFADFFIHQANQEGQSIGRIVVVQSTGATRANFINRQAGRYHVLIRGLAGGATIETVNEVRSISRALVASENWLDVLNFARTPNLRWIISNTAENGYTLDAADHAGSTPPSSFPAKLLLILKARFEAGLPKVTMLPCELFEHNADKLLALVLQLGREWNLATDFVRWLEHECDWRNTLVDRIVAATPADHPLAKDDALLTVAEPFAFWAIEDKHQAGAICRNPAILTTADVQPYFLRKVRILNAAHTALLTKALPRGFKIVRDAVNDPAIDAWLQKLLHEEIIPALEGRVESPREFAAQTLERFRNPFLEHKLSDIAQYHDSKVKIRLETTRDEFVAKFGRRPPLLDEAVAAKL
jgi:tagaturonate reductase